jgi:hypothetical protein
LASPLLSLRELGRDDGAAKQPHISHSQHSKRAQIQIQIDLDRIT